MNAPSKFLIGIISLSMTVSYLFLIYWVITFEKAKQCLVCTEADGEFSNFAPLAWWSTWAGYTTTVTWAGWVWRRAIKNLDPQDCLILIELSLPLSIFAMGGYTLYLATSGWGKDLVDDELCYTLMDAATPREGTTETVRNVYLSAHIFASTFLHYICPIINVVLYFKCYTRRAWKPFWTIGFVTLLSIVVILVQELGNAVMYCTGNIYLVAGMAVASCTVIQAIFFYRPNTARVGDNRANLEHGEVKTVATDLEAQMDQNIEMAD